MTKRSGLGVVFMILVLINFASVNAYIDPGTGVAVASSIGSSIVAYLVAFFVLLGGILTKIFINPIKRFFRMILGKK